MTIPPLLSFCIPTFNRAPFLRALLQSIVKSLPPGENRIEILVSDNASTDDTAEVVKDMGRLLPMLSFHRNATNVGAENNMLGLVDHSQGRYLWLFGDDDLLLPHAFTTVLEALADNPDYLVLNYGTINRDGTPHAMGRAYPIPENRPLKSRDEVMSLFGLRLGLIAGVIFRRDVFFTVPREDYLRHADSGLSFLYASLRVAAQEGYGKFIAPPIFSYRANNSDHAPTAERWTDVYGRALRELMVEMRVLGYEKLPIRRFLTGVIRDYYAFCIFGDRIRGRSTYTYYRSLLSHYADIPAAWLLMLSFFIPQWMTHGIRFAWRRYHRLKTELFYP